MSEHVGDTFQQHTQYHRGHLSGGSLDWASKPDTYKRYPSAPKIALQEPEQEDGPPLWQMMRDRRSVRDFQQTPMTHSELSQLLWASQGITRTFQGFDFRTAPSAGALYPVETYLVIHSVQEVDPGLYHYCVKHHELDQLKQGDFRRVVAGAALDQEMAYTANVVFMWTGIFQRSKWKYQQRAYRYVYLDAGHIAGNLALAATSIGIGSCQIAALFDDEVNELIEVDGIEESVLYMSVVGRY